MSKELSAKDFFEIEKPFLNNFDPVENVATYGKLDMFEWAERFAAARLEAYKEELKKAIYELEDTALAAVSHVGIANYQYRESEAKQAIRKKVDDLTSNLTKNETNESK